MLWFAFNENMLHTESGLPPIKLEIHCTVFGFNCQESPLGNTVFVKYKIISHASEDFPSNYFGLFSDFAIGNPNDDFFGSDKERTLVFAYNGDEDDEGGYGNHAPVMAVKFLRGPLDHTQLEVPLSHVMPVDVNMPTEGLAAYNLLGGLYTASKGRHPENGKVRVFPNPFGNDLNIDLTGLTKPVARIDLLNMMGQPVWAASGSDALSESLSISGATLPAGVYLLVITDQYGAHSVSKVVKK